MRPDDLIASGQSGSRSPGEMRASDEFLPPCTSESLIYVSGLNIFNMVLELYFSNTYPCAQDENSLAWSKVRTF